MLSSVNDESIDPSSTSIDVSPSHPSPSDSASFDDSKLTAVPLDILDAPGDGRTVLVSGASGYIAAHIIALLLKRNWRVRGTVRDLRKTKHYAHLRLIESETSSPYPLELVEANLLKDDGWMEAVKGCDFVIHTASPFLLEEVDNADVMVKPAVQGTLSVLRACAKTPSVKRVVLTSSEVAITKSKYEKPNYVYSEKDWSDWPSCAAYPQSKTLAEMEAWRFWRRLNGMEEPENKLNEGREWLADFQWSDDYKNKFELSVINPSYVQGKLLAANGCSSEVLIKRFMTGQIPAVPHCGTNIIAVEDVALAHVRALLSPSANGRRFLLSSGFAWFDEQYSNILAEEFDVNGYKIRQIKAPAPLLRLSAMWDKQAKLLIPSIGKMTVHNCSAARLLLGMNDLSSPKKMIVEMAHSLIDLGIVTDNRHRHPIHQTIVRWDSNASTSACRQCAKSFNIVQRKHHCRLCGKIFCGECCKGRIRGERSCAACVESSGEAPRLAIIPVAQPVKIVNTTNESNTTTELQTPPSAVPASSD